jgi:hypothetical protein
VSARFVWNERLGGQKRKRAQRVWMEEKKERTSGRREKGRQVDRGCATRQRNTVAFTRRRPPPWRCELTRAALRCVARAREKGVAYARWLDGKRRKWPRWNGVGGWVEEVQHLMHGCRCTTGGAARWV